jgi:hypothetical protein
VSGCLNSFECFDPVAMGCIQSKKNRDDESDDRRFLNKRSIIADSHLNDNTVHIHPEMITKRDIVEQPDTIELRRAIDTGASSLLTENDLQRFLRARLHDVSKAADMVNHWYKWWNTPLPGCENMLPAMTADCADVNEHIYQELMPHANLGVDKEGAPVYWEKTGLSEFTC